MIDVFIFDALFVGYCILTENYVIFIIYIVLKDVIR